MTQFGEERGEILVRAQHSLNCRRLPGRIVDEQKPPSRERPEPIGWPYEIGPLAAHQGTFGDPIRGIQDRRQQLLSRLRGHTMIEPPAYEIIEVGGRLRREAARAAHKTGLDFRAMVWRTRCATSSGVK